jgi:hypothetical protein
MIELKGNGLRGMGKMVLGTFNAWKMILWRVKKS